MPFDNAMETESSQHSRRNRRSSINLNHLSLAPLTSSVPLKNVEEPEHSIHSYYPFGRHTSYLEGKSAPTTPGILSRSSSRANLLKSTYGSLPKSKSSANMTTRQHQLRYGADPPNRKPKHATARDDLNLHSLTAEDRSDSDWLLRAGALLSSGARESKGQSWLVSRESSTNLTAQGYEEEEEAKQEQAIGMYSRRSSIRGSATGGDADDEYSPVPTGLGFGGGSRTTSRFGSVPTSRSQSRRGSRANNVFTTLTNSAKYQGPSLDEEDDLIIEPDFVDVEDGAYDVVKDEVIIKRLAKDGNLGFGVWVEKLIRWSLFAVEEDEEDSDTETSEEKPDVLKRPPQALDAPSHNVDGALDALNEQLPPPGDGEGVWQDAAWLLSIATKVFL